MASKNRSPRVAAAFSLAAVLFFAEAPLGADPIFTDAEKVEFESAAFSYAPSPFKLRQAKKLGIPVEVKTEPAVPLIGYLARPGGDAPRAAIVLMHTCAGLSEHEEMWSRRLVSWGYVVLSVDSLKPRGFEYICDGRIGGGAAATPWLRALDAYGAKRYLAARPFVDPDRIAVMGMSHGGMTVLEAIKQYTFEGLKTDPFRAAIAFYPLCSVAEPIGVPTLILSGSEDSWTPVELCAQYVEKLKPRHEIALQVFAGAHHAFDHPGIDIIELGYIVRSDPKAAAEAARMAREFLEKWL